MVVAVVVIDTALVASLQRYELPAGAPETVNTIGLPSHTVVAPVIVKLGNGVTDTKCDALDVQPLASVTVTV